MAEFVESKLQLAAIVLAGELNYTCAAEKLGITPSALRLLIWDLEHQLEFRIFQKIEKNVEVTEAGQVLVSCFRSFLARIKRLDDWTVAGNQDDRQNNRD